MSITPNIRDGTLPGNDDREAIIWRALRRRVRANEQLTPSELEEHRRGVLREAEERRR